MCDYLEVDIFMTQNNMLPAYTKVNQAKFIFIFTSRLSPRIDSMTYLVNLVIHMQMNWNFQLCAFIWHK